MKRRQGSLNETLWFVSYSDLITAILAVLILIMSFSKIDIEKVDHANRLMKNDKLVTLSELKKEYTKLINKYNLSDTVNVTLSEDGLSINTSSTIQFDSNSAKLIEKNGMALLKPILEKIVSDSKYREVSIIGHTDDTGTNEWNWKLSSQRAYNTMMYLMKIGLKDKHSKIISYASNKPYKNIDKLSGNEKKIARASNRRVEIVIGRSY